MRDVQASWRSELRALPAPARPQARKRYLLAAERRVSLDQALIVTASHRADADLPVVRRRARAFRAACERLPIAADPDEILVGNRTPRPRAGVIFPEAAVAWYDRELASLPTRAQDPFAVDPTTVRRFRDEVLPFWSGSTLEDAVYAGFDAGIRRAARVVKINQRDHAQGHIIPDLGTWLALGPTGLRERLRARPGWERDDQLVAMDEALAGARRFVARYGEFCAGRPGLAAAGRVCAALADRSPRSFHEALQSTWFLLVLLHLESNASSFSPGRLDRELWPYLERDLCAGRCDAARALELVEAFFCKCNEIVYLRNAESARYFAGFPIGFNVCVGGVDADGHDATNPLTWLCLRAQDDLGLPQPNLSLRVHPDSPRVLLEEATRVIARGSGMPQLFNDTAVIPALEAVGLDPVHARDYGVVGCVELAGRGNTLGWSDAAMVNLVKCLELAVNDGICLQSGERLGPRTGTLADRADFAADERALGAQLDAALDLTRRGCAVVEAAHAERMPSPFLSCVVDGCLDRAVDVTAGGARYNLSGIQAVQVANLADGLAVLRAADRDTAIDRRELFDALRDDWRGHAALRARCLHRVPKYGNDVARVDELGARWARRFAGILAGWTNPRGGPCQMGLYTVSAHLPMGAGVGATPDGRRSGEPLADGGASPVAGRDRRGPTAVLRSVARLPFLRAGNGALLNLKFLPTFFADAEGIAAFAALVEAWCRLGIPHVQFNVLDAADLRAARTAPERWRHLTVRVAGYTAYFVELAADLQDEIIARTAHGTD